jgi:superfamily II DNA or RNA helicase
LKNCPYIILIDFILYFYQSNAKGYKYNLLNKEDKFTMENKKILNTYLGSKGYTILKNELTIELQKQIRNDLTVKPHIMGSPMMNKEISFPSYRESSNKMYVPHYYGVEHFGYPTEMKLCEGTTIQVSFHGKLRENQEVVVNTYLRHVLKNKYGGGLLELPCAYGKTILSLNIISQLQKKTLIIVHKEFLMNQWIERMEQFLPSARIGKIQGQIIDIDNKDIVIGMLQSLSMKEYPQSIFESFGLTIIDEVHHISSEVFSNSLFKINTKYMLGLSATMNRKDGTSHVFKMFLGDVIFKGKREEEFEVIVRAIEYQVNDDEFNEVKYDYRGNPAYSTMISKLCEYNRRSEFILKILIDLLEENENQQIMILGHNKNLLKYLHDAISHRNISTVGYYVGGMKEKALKESETKKVIIATYAMAAEGLDIKSLTTLIMATPKTDIEQSIGRILREKHSNPIVVDIVDSHELFKNQWKKRKTFYKRENYKIIYTTSLNYNKNTNSSNWIVQNNPKECFIRKEKKEENTKKKPISLKSNSSADKSITNDSDIEDESDKEVEVPKDKYLCGTCLLKINK